MKDIEILRKSLSTKSRYDPCHEALENVEKLIKDASKFFSIHGFDGDKHDWLVLAGQIEE